MRWTFAIFKVSEEAIKERNKVRDMVVEMARNHNTLCCKTLQKKGEEDQGANTLAMRLHGKP